MNDLKDIPEVPISLPPPRFANPWKGLKGDPTAATVNCLMPQEAFHRIKRCRLEGGTIQTTMNLLWIKLIDLLEKKGINDYADVREFEDAVNRAVLVLPEDIGGGGAVLGSTTPAVNTTANVGDDVRAVEPIRNAATSEPLVANDASDNPTPSSSRGKGGRKGGKRKG